MITYKYDEEKIFALHFADRLLDENATRIILADEVSDINEAIYLSHLFWKMNAKAIEDDQLGLKIPCEGSSEYWLEKLYNSWEGYMIKAGYVDQWDDASESA